MFKVISAELKKIVAKPGIYILAVLLAVILVLGVFIYNPTSYSTTDNTYQNYSVIENYRRFVGTETSTNDGYKDEADNLVSTTISKIDNYEINGMTYNTYVNYLYREFIDRLDLYADYSPSRNPNLSVNDAEMESRRNGVLSSYRTLYYTVTNGYTYGSRGSYPIITTEQNSYDFNNVYSVSSTLLSTVTNDPANICEEFENQYLPTLRKCLNSFIYSNLNEGFKLNYTSTSSSTTKYSTLQARLSLILVEINNLYNEALNDNDGVNLNQDKINEMAELCNKYTATCYVYSQLVDYELMTRAFSLTSTTQQMNLLYLNQDSEYNANSNLIKYSYLFDNNKIDTDYAHPLTISVTSNTETNAYDYAYFILKLFSFVIIVYAVMAGCHSIAGEIKEGSMRYYAIRPVSRLSILFGKFLAILIMSIIMIIFSSIIAILVGGAVYSFESLEILTIFNGTTAITMHPICMILIYILSLIFEVMVYLSIAMFLSCLLKSDLLSVTILLVLYLINTLLPVFVTGVNSWLTYYPFSHISLYALFGSSIYANNSNFFYLLLGSKIYAGTGLTLTIVMIVLFVLVFNLLSGLIFRRKEL